MKSRARLTTKVWAKAQGVSTGVVPPPALAEDRFTRRTPRAVATRALVLQGVVAVAFGVDPRPIARWFRSQRIWRAVSPSERAVLGGATLAPAERVELQWRQEAEWTLLWALGKVEALGLPTRGCDTRRLVDSLPAPGSDLAPFLLGARLRNDGELLAEDERTYALHCAAAAMNRRREALPRDFLWPVNFERRRAFEWLDADEAWDEVTCDA